MVDTTANDPVVEEMEEGLLVEPYDDSPSVRPIEIVITAILGFIISAAIVPLAYILTVGDIGAVQPLDMIVIFIFMIAGSVFSHALFQMQRWSLYGYTALVVVTQLILLLSANWTFVLLLIPLAFLIPAATQWSKLE